MRPVANFLFRRQFTLPRWDTFIDANREEPALSA
jgi:hypothetical protein